jgi:serine/threonine protein kinase
MSDVYEAVDERSGAVVAVKIVRSGDPEFARRLAQEAKALERLEHPGLVRLIDAGLTGVETYLIMELVDGSTLARTLRGGALGPGRTAAIGARLADALAYIHGQGIVHRDVKPSNVLVDARGQARLGDFGIARLLDASTLTVAGTTLGTAAYMAPEQLEDHHVGPSADIWSLGMVLLESLTGRRVYEGSAAEVVARRLAAPVPLPSDLPVPWKLVLSGMLDHRPDQRLSGAEAAALLDSSPLSVPWTPPGTPDSGHRAPATPHDLTSLAPGPVATALLAPDSTRVLDSAPSASSARTQSRRWIAGVLGALLFVVVCVGLLVGLGSSTGDPTRPGAATRPPGTSTTSSSTTTTTTVPDAPTALAALVRDVTSGVTAGTVDSGSSQVITSSAEQAVTSEAAAQPNQAADDLQQAATTIANGVQSGVMTAGEGATLQTDLATLASALGLSSAAAPPTTQPAPTHRGHGKGK